MKKIALLSLVLIVFFQISNSQSIPDSDLYLAQTPPGKTPIVFAPDIVSVSGRGEYVIAFSPDSTHIFFSTDEWPNRETKYIEYKNGQWTIPVIASFSTTRSADEPIFSPNGKKVYYYAYKPGSSTNSDIYFSEKTNDSWGQPASLGSPVNSLQDEWHPCIVNDSTIYYINGSGAICRSQFMNGVYENRTVLPASINDGTAYGDPYVSPNESYIIFNSKRSGGFGGVDLYISFRSEDKIWTDPKNLGNTINTSTDDYSGDITPDEKYMTFGRNGDIYWVSSSFIDSLKLLSFPTSIQQSFEDAFQVYPSPSKGIINISFGTKSYEKASYEIVSINGPIIKSGSFNNTSSISIDLTGRSNGIYLIKVIIDNKTISKKICLE